MTIITGRVFACKSKAIKRANGSCISTLGRSRRETLVPFRGNFQVNTRHLLFFMIFSPNPTIVVISKDPMDKNIDDDNNGQFAKDFPRQHYLRWAFQRSDVTIIVGPFPSTSTTIQDCRYYFLRGVEQ